MAGTCDPQLAQSQRTEGFSTPTGVQRAIRPFTGEATPKNIVDYLNREQFPVLHAVRSKVNEVYLPSKLQAPSANPLGFVFDVSTAGGDPGTGFVRLNAVPENTATILRVSQLNAPRRVDVATWLSVMQGSVTSPLGVITVSVQADPTRFIRANLTSMIDQGTYWDLGISIVESSHNNPFVDGSPVQIGFIAGVATGGVSLATSIAGIQGISAGASSISRGTLVFNNANGVSFGLNGSTLTGSVVQGIRVSAGTGSLQNVVGLTFINTNGVSFNYDTIFGRLQASIASSLTAINVSAGTASNLLSALTFNNANGVSFGLNASTLTASIASSLTAINLSAGTTSSNVSAFTFSNSNGMSFGFDGSTITGIAGLRIRAGGGAGTTNTVTGFFLQQGSGVNWAVTTGASSMTLLPLLAFGLSANGSAASVTGMSFADSNGITFGLSSGTITASIASSLTAINVSGGTTSQNLSALTFSNSNGVSFGLNGSVLTASVGAGGAAGSISAGTTNVALGQVVFSNSNNVSFGLNGSTITASATVASSQGSVRISAGTTNNLLSNFSFADSNNHSWGINGSTITGQPFFNITGANGSSVNATVLAFTTGVNNVGFAVSTNASGATVRAAASISVSAGTTNVAASQLSFANANSVSFGLVNSTITASVSFPQAQVTFSAGTQGAALASLVFSNSNGISFGLNGSTITGSVAAAAGGFGVSAGTTNITGGGLSFLDNARMIWGLNGSSVTAEANVQHSASNASVNATRIVYGSQTGVSVNFSMATAASVGTLRANIDPTQFQPALPFWINYQGLVAGAGSILVSNLGTRHWIAAMLPGFSGNLTANTMDIAMAGGANATNSSLASWALTVRGAVYTLANSTLLSALNSFSTLISAASRTSGAAAVSQNNSFAGGRWITFGTAAWSSLPVFSAGVQYWIGVNFSSNTAANPLAQWPLLRSVNGNYGFSGTAGNTVTHAVNLGMLPMGGVVGSAAVPLTVASSQFLDAGVNVGANPLIGLRNSIVLV